MHQLPEKFTQRLALILPVDKYETVLERFRDLPPCSFRCNTLKPGRLSELRFPITSINQVKETYFCAGEHRDELLRSALVTEGRIYAQGASSMLVSEILAPRAGERVLDACAAPGSKTSHMAALMDNQGEITALEAVRGRFFKLRSVLELLGVTNAKAVLIDARRFRIVHGMFDRILVDAPCSSEGRFHCLQPKSLKYWSEHKIKEMRHKQKGILKNALGLLRPGGTLVYSTCTFAPEENEEVISWALKKGDGQFELADIDVGGIGCYPPLREWKGRSYDPRVDQCVRILPEGIWDGFFLAKLRRKL